MIPSLPRQHVHEPYQTTGSSNNNSFSKGKNHLQSLSLSGDPKRIRQPLPPLHTGTHFLVPSPPPPSRTPSPCLRLLLDRVSFAMSSHAGLAFKFGLTMGGAPSVSGLGNHSSPTSRGAEGKCQPEWDPGFPCEKFISEPLPSLLKGQVGTLGPTSGLGALQPLAD